MKNVKTPLIIGALHLPYFGTQDPGRSLAEVEDYVLGNASIFYENGINKLILQDENIVPERAEPETIAVMAAISRLVRRELPKLHIGIIVQAHDPKASIAIAHASGAEFVRQKVFAGVMLKAEGLRTGVGWVRRFGSLRIFTTGRVRRCAMSRLRTLPDGRTEWALTG